MARNTLGAGATDAVAPDLPARTDGRAMVRGQEHPSRAVATPLLPVLAGLAALGAVAVIAFVDPNEPGHYPVCPSLFVFGVYCPGCGSLRALHDLAHLDIGGAWGMNPLVFAVIPWAAWTWARWLGESLGLPFARRLAPAWTIWLVFAGILAFGVARNVPALAPFLAP